MNICGIDPGLKGGLAILDNGKVYGYPMPLSGKDINVMAIVDLLRSHSVKLVAMEQVHAMPGQGVTSMFSFGKSYGMLMGAVMASGIPLELVTPQKWKSVTLQGTAKDKDAMIAFCRRRYPEVNLVPPRCRTANDGIADAVGILHYFYFLNVKKEVA